MSIARPIFAANWKLNHGPQATRAFFREFLPRLGAAAPGTVIFFPPALSLAAAVSALESRPEIWLGVQNLFWEPQGAFTGELSAPIAREAGARVALIGHSERRHLFGETDEECSRKLNAALASDLSAILCVGETLEEREAGYAVSRVQQQLQAALAACEGEDLGRLLIAYEPVWAIGTGRTATPEDAASMHQEIRAFLRERFADGADPVPILYGGSVNAQNSEALLRAPEVNGLLIGGASLDPLTFAQICSGGR